MYNGAWEPVRQLIPNIRLAEYQCRTALSIATEARHMILFETGLGKTLTTIAGLLMRRNCGATRKILWLSPLNILDQTREAFSIHTRLRGRLVTGTTKDARLRDYSGLDILFINFEAFDERAIIDWMIDIWSMYDTVVIDEAHLIANPFSSNRNGFIWWLAYKIPNTYLLTATPVISRIDQYASLLCLLQHNLEHMIGYRNQIHKNLWLPEKHPELLSYKKRDVNIPIDIIQFEEKVVRTRAHGTALFKDTRGTKTEQPYNILLSLIKEHNLSHFLIYSNLTIHHKELKDFLVRETDFVVEILNGETKDKRAVQSRFNTLETDILIFSLNSGIDLPAESVVFYEWDVYAAQSLGRAIREEEISKKFRVWFLLNTLYETDMFKNTVVKTGLLSEKALGKNIFKNLI